MAEHEFTSTKFRHILTGGWWLVSLDPLRHRARAAWCKNVRDGRTQYVRRINLVDDIHDEKVPNLHDK